MIRRLRLKNWRSYDAFDTTLSEGTTFVVAPNGVGKTSLVLALAWGIYGDHSDVDARECIRAGADAAEVEVDLLLPDGRDLAILRQIKHRGRPKVTCTLAGTQIDEAAATIVLEEAFSTDLRVAARLSLMLGGGHLASQEALDLKSHLHHAFGVAELLATAELAESVAKEAEKNRGAARAITQEHLTNRAEIEAEIAQLQTQILTGRQQAEALELERRNADQIRSMVQQLSSHARQQALYEQSLQNLHTEIQAMLAADAPPSDTAATVDQLRSSLQLTTTKAEAAAESHATAKGSAAAAAEALSLLSGERAQCPTCMRAIGATELEAARTQHKRRAQEAAKQAEELSLAEHAHRQRHDAIAALLTRIESLQPPTRPDFANTLPDMGAAQAAHDKALEAVRNHSEELGALTSRLEGHVTQVATDDQLTRDEAALRLAYRREAISLAAARALREATDRLTAQRIEPIATEVRGRWKRLFANEGLKLRPDGSIVRIESGKELGWKTLSGGERIWARIVTHLLVLGSSTKLPFAWFDEPLEHLDPQLRRVVAATLATATQGGAPKQLLVTTYEDTIARQLAADTPNASLINVRATTTQPGPRTEPGASERDTNDLDGRARRAS